MLKMVDDRYVPLTPEERETLISVRNAFCAKTGLNVTQGVDYIIRHGTNKLFKLGLDGAVDVLCQSFRVREDTVVRPI